MEDRELTPEEYYQVVRAGRTAEMIGYSPVHLARLEKAGLFQKRFPLNKNGGKYGAKGHFLGWIIDYLKARAAESRSAVVIAVLAVASVVAPFLAKLLA